MNSNPKKMLCDVVMPSLGDIMKDLVENNIIAVIFLLVILLVAASIITVCIVSRKKNRDNSNNTNYNIEEKNPWEQ